MTALTQRIAATFNFDFVSISCTSLAGPADRTVRLSVSLSVRLPACLSLCLPACLPVYPVCLSACLSSCNVSLSAPSASLPACLATQSVCLSVSSSLPVSSSALSVPRPAYAPFAFKSEQSAATHKKMLIIKVSGKRYNIFMLHAAASMNHHKAGGRQG